MWMTSLTTHENSIVFGCKQQMAYEMRISDWSSDVCSSVLFSFALFASFADQKLYAPRVGFMVRVQLQIPEQAARHDEQRGLSIGRASRRERACPHVSISVVAVPL